MAKQKHLFSDVHRQLGVSDKAAQDHRTLKIDFTPKQREKLADRPLKPIQDPEFQTTLLRNRGYTRREIKNAFASYNAKLEQDRYNRSGRPPKSMKAVRRKARS